MAQHRSPRNAGLAALLLAAAPLAAADLAPLSAADVLAASRPEDWRSLDPESTLYLELASGRAVVALAPEFAPRHVAHVKNLARRRFYDGLSIYRVQENYVVQGGDPDGERKALAGEVPIRAELTRRDLAALAFTALPGPDGYAPEVGYAGVFPAARSPQRDEAWLVHCPGAFAMPRDEAIDSGTTDFYVVIGHAPRHLDRNTTVFGRVVAGMEHLTTLPRGHGALGFYETSEERQPIRAVRVAADLPAGERTDLELLRTDTPTFQAWVEARRNRREPWFHHQTGYVDVCNVALPVRQRPAPAP